MSKYDKDGYLFSRDEVSNGKKPRRLIVRDVVGSQYPLSHNAHREIDLTGLVHANTQSPIYAVVQEQCNLGCWHDTSLNDLQCWGPD